MTLAHPGVSECRYEPGIAGCDPFRRLHSQQFLVPGPGMFIGSDGMSRPKRGLIEFNIPAFSFPAGATITGAGLSLVLGRSSRR